MVMLLRVYFIDTIEIKAKDIISYYLKKFLIISDYIIWFQNQKKKLVFWI